MVNKVSNWYFNYGKTLNLNNCWLNMMHRFCQFGFFCLLNVWKQFIDWKLDSIHFEHNDIITYLLVRQERKHVCPSTFFFDYEITIRSPKTVVKNYKCPFTSHIFEKEQLITVKKKLIEFLMVIRVLNNR